MSDEASKVGVVEDSDAVQRRLDEVKVWEIVNPSDDYTIEGPDRFCSYLLPMVSMQLGLTDESGEHGTLSMAAFMSGSQADAAMGLVMNGLEPQEFIDRNATAIAAVARSVFIGDRTDRKAVLPLLEAIKDPEERARLRAEYDDKKRSSMNNIGADFTKLAEKFEAMASAGADGEEVSS